MGGNISNPKLSGVELIAGERKRQIEKEGWSEQHDDSHCNGELADAAAYHAATAPAYRHWRGQQFESIWPEGWDSKWDHRKKSDRVRQLAIAGALIAAEIDRLQRCESSR